MKIQRSPIPYLFVLAFSLLGLSVLDWNINNELEKIYKVKPTHTLPGKKLNAPPDRVLITCALDSNFL